MQEIAGDRWDPSGSTLCTYLLSTDYVFILKVYWQEWHHFFLLFFNVSLMQIFDEEHNVWFLDNGGAMLAVLHATTPIRHLWWVIATVIIFVGRSCTCSYNGKLHLYGFILFVWCSLWLHLMFWKADGSSFCMIIDSALRLEKCQNYRRLSVTAFYSCLDMMVWVLLCKWKVEQDGNLRLRMPS